MRQGLVALSEGESAPPPSPQPGSSGGKKRGMKMNESERGDADQQPSRLPASSLCRSPHQEGASEGVGER